MVFQVQIQDCCFRSSVVWILPSRVSLLKPTILQADVMSLLCLEMFRNDMRALWLSDFVFLSLFFLSHSLSHLSHLSVPLLFETCESDEVKDKKRPCFTVSGLMKGEAVSIFMAQNQTIQFPLQPLRPIFYFTMNSVWALESIHYTYEQKHPQNYCHKLRSEHWVIPNSIKVKQWNQ